MTLPVMTPVESGHIESIGHDPNTNTLTVKFKNGAVYSHDDVPATVHAEFLAAPSPGTFFNSRVKGVFRHRRH